MTPAAWWAYQPPLITGIKKPGANRANLTGKLAFNNCQADRLAIASAA